MLEREEKEQPLRHGKGPANRSEREDSPFDEFEVDYSDDEYEEEGVHPIFLEIILGETILRRTPRNTRRLAKRSTTNRT